MRRGGRLISFRRQVLYAEVIVFVARGLHPPAPGQRHLFALNCKLLKLFLLGVVNFAAHVEAADGPLLYNGGLLGDPLKIFIVFVEVVVLLKGPIEIFAEVQHSTFEVLHDHTHFDYFLVPEIVGIRVQARGVVDNELLGIHVRLLNPKILLISLLARLQKQGVTQLGIPLAPNKLVITHFTRPFVNYHLFGDLLLHYLIVQALALLLIRCPGLNFSASATLICFF